MKYNQGTLNKVEKVLDEAEYVVRYERGTFQSGYCILEAKKVVVLNKFLDVEGRINTLMDLLPQLNINIDLLTHESQKLYEEIIKKLNAAREAAAKEKTESEAATAQPELFDNANSTTESSIEKIGTDTTQETETNETEESSIPAESNTETEDKSND